MITQIEVSRLTQTNKDQLSRTERIHQAVLCKLAAEGLTIFADWPKIETVLNRTVSPKLCVASATEMRNMGEEGRQ